MSVRVGVPSPPVVDDSGGDGGSEWVVLIKARHDIDAHLLTGRLSEAGIETKTVKDRGAPGAWLYGGSNPWAPVAIFVRRRQLQDARVTLAEISFEGPPAELPRVLADRDRRRHPLMWWVTALILGLVFTALVLRQVTRFIEPCEIPVLCETDGGP
ncbi:MAG: DUF2007 domain-containing protein [Actinomycetota bacterium]